MTYKEIQEAYKKKHNSTIKSCWIADVKRKMGIPVRRAYNRINDIPKYPCPKDKFKQISEVIKSEI